MTQVSGQQVKRIKLANEAGEVKTICLCAAESAVTHDSNCLMAKPGSAYWNACADLEPEDIGQQVIVQLPRRNVVLTVTEFIEEVPEHTTH